MIRITQFLTLSNIECIAFKYLCYHLPSQSLVYQLKTLKNSCGHRSRPLLCGCLLHTSFPLFAPSHLYQVGHLRAGSIDWQKVYRSAYWLHNCCETVQIKSARVLICIRIELQYKEFDVQYGESKPAQSHDVYAVWQRVERAITPSEAPLLLLLFCAMRQSES